MKQLEHTLYEKRILESVSFPFVVNLTACFKDNVYIFLMMPFVSGGDMFFHLQRKQKFDEKLSRFYGAQILLGLEYLHFCDIIYRDLKPENILIDHRGYLKLSDLGFCKIVKGRTWTLCGTPEYIAPEIILSKGYGKSVDWWSYGILLYEMAAGRSPFVAKDPMSIYEKIITGKFKSPQHFSLPLTDLVKNLLQGDLTRRFGNLKGGTADMKLHKWFQDLDWLKLYHQELQAPFVPTVLREDDNSNFETFRMDKLKTNSENLHAKEFELF